MRNNNANVKIARKAAQAARQARAIANMLAEVRKSEQARKKVS